MGNLLFYSSDSRAGAVANLTPNSFHTAKEFPAHTFSQWTDVVAWNDWILFYNRDKRSAAFGILTANDFVTKYQPLPGTFGRWTHIIKVADGWVFYNSLTGAAAVGSVRGPAGAYLFTTTADLPAGSLSEWTHIVADGQKALFYNRMDGSGAIVTVTAQGMKTNVSYGPASFGTWTHVVNNGPTVFFYNRDTAAAAIGTLTGDGFHTNVNYNPGSFGVWTHIVSDGATLLFYNQDGRSAAIGTLSPSGFTTNMTFAAGQFSRWTHVTGDSAWGPEEQQLHVEVVLAQWQRAPGLSTVLGTEFYRRYMFDLSNEQGLGRYWFDQSGGRLRFTGHANEWVALSKAPSDPSVNGNRSLQAALAVADAQKKGWHPGDAFAVVVFIACDQAKGIDAGALPQPINIDGIDRWVAVLLADSANYVQFSRGVVADFRFDFNCHEIGHLVGRKYSFGHAFGPTGTYDSPYCIMAAMTYGYLGGGVTYDPWTPASDRPPEEHTKGPGLAGSTRAGCGWARTRRIQTADLQQPLKTYLAQLDDHTSSLPQVIEYATTVNGVSTIYTIEFRNRLAEHDQSLPTAIVLCQREGSPWSTNPGWKPYSSTFVADAAISSNRPLPSVNQPGVIRADVLEVGPTLALGGRTAPPWLRVRLSKG